MEFLSKEQVESGKVRRIRNYLSSKLEKYEGEPIKLDIDNLDEILFSDSDTGRRFAIPVEIAKKIDMIGVSFDEFYASGFDFSGFKGVEIDPNKLYEKQFLSTNFAGVTFTEEFDNCSFEEVSFAGSKGAVIKPSNNVILSGNNFKNVTFTGAISSGDITYCSFEGSNNAVINLDVPGVQYPIRVLYGAVLTDATIIGTFDGCSIKGANFKGAKNENGENIKINPNVLASFDLSGCVFDGVEFTQEIIGLTNMANADFTGSKGFKIRTVSLGEGSLDYAKLNGVTFYCGNTDGICLGKIIDADFTGSKGECLCSVYNEDDPVLSIKKTELINCDLTDAYFSHDYSLNDILRCFNGLDTCTYKNMSFGDVVENREKKENEELSRVFQKIDNAIANSKRNN